MSAHVVTGAERPEASCQEEVRLPASRRISTGRAVFPRIPEASPSNPLYEPILLSATGILYTYTVSHPNPKSGRPPFFLGYVDFPEKARVLGRVRTPEGGRPQIGAPVRVLSSTDGSYEFVPVSGHKA